MYKLSYFMNKNRQVTRTKDLIESAFINLLNRKSISKITVKQICMICNINRGTFYNHYRDIDDLMNQIENNLIKELELCVSKHFSYELDKNTLPMFQDILRFINKKHKIVRLLLKKGGNSLFVDKLIRLFKVETTNQKRVLNIYSNSKNYNYFVEYTIYGCMGIISKWLKDGRKQTSSEIALLLENIVINGINSLKED